MRAVKHAERQQKQHALQDENKQTDQERKVDLADAKELARYLKPRPTKVIRAFQKQGFGFSPYLVRFR
jgi:hypothetical protein